IMKVILLWRGAMRSTLLQKNYWNKHQKNASFFQEERIKHYVPSLTVRTGHLFLFSNEMMSLSLIQSLPQRLHYKLPWKKRSKPFITQMLPSSDLEELVLQWHIYSIRLERM